MKKYPVILIFLFAILAIPAQVMAVEFVIENSRIDAHLQENGDAHVTEQHRYAFEGKFNGITRSIIPKENTTIENFQASEGNTSLDVEKEDEMYKIHRGGADETVTIELSYIIQNAVETDSELGQFYWPFFDNSNEAAYESMDIYIYPPQPADDVLAVGYDEAQGTAEIQTDGTVQFALGKVEEGENGDIRAAYEGGLFTSVEQAASSSIREDILADKAAQEAQAAAFQNRQSFLAQISPFVVAASGMYLLGLLFMAWRKKQRTSWEVERSSLQDSLLPKEEMSLPAIIYYMGGMSKGGEILSASLLNLIRKGYVEQKNENEFVVVNRETEYEHERLLIDWLFYRVGIDGTFTSDDVEVYTKVEENQETYQEDFQNWLNAVKQEVNQHNLYERKTRLRWTVALTSMLLIPLMILLGLHGLPMWMFLSLILFAGLLSFAIFYYPKSVKGVRIKKQWEEFSSKYDNISEQQWNEWMSDEQMQAFIYAIGTNNKKMMDKNKALIESQPVTPNYGFTTNDMLIFLVLSGTLTNQFNEANQTVSAAGSSTMAGTGAGVGGGGGGSGAF